MKKIIYYSMVIVVLFICAACSKEREKRTGKYISQESDIIIQMELKETGEGSWATEEDNISFKWEIRENKIWLHTKSGGVIIGKIDNDTIKIGLTQGKIYLFKKMNR